MKNITMTVEVFDDFISRATKFAAALRSQRIPDGAADAASVEHAIRGMRRPSRNETRFFAAQTTREANTILRLAQQYRDSTDAEMQGDAKERAYHRRRVGMDIGPATDAETRDIYMAAQSLVWDFALRWGGSATDTAPPVIATAD